MPELLLKLSITLHIQYRYIEHVHEEVSCKKKYLLAKWLLIFNLAILYNLAMQKSKQVSEPEGAPQNKYSISGSSARNTCSISRISTMSS